MISVPDSVVDTPKTDDPRSRARLPRWLLAALATSATALSLMLVTALLVQLVRPAITAARNSARRSSCQHQVEQLLHAMFAYRRDRGTFPPAYTVDAQGTPLHSWRVLLLPYLGPEAQALHAHLRLDERWDSSHNSSYLTQIPHAFVCPDDQPLAVGDTSYCVVTGPQYAFRPQSGQEATKLTDDPTTMLLIVEVQRSGINWMDPIDVSPVKLGHGINSGIQGACGSEHPGGVAVVGTADGRGHALSESVAPDDLHAMATVDGGELPRPPYVP